MTKRLNVFFEPWNYDCIENTQGVLRSREISPQKST